MDETLVLVGCDLSGRDYLGWAVTLPAAKVGTFDTELAKEFWLGFVRNCPGALHFHQLAGENTHHILEACFKGAGRALKEAVAQMCIRDRSYDGEMPICGCGAKIDRRNYGPGGWIDRRTYYIAVRPEDEARARDMLAQT